MCSCKRNCNPNHICKKFKGERQKLTSYVIIFGEKAFFSITKLVFRGKRDFSNLT